jgi:hypothetical protein
LNKSRPVCILFLILILSAFVYSQKSVASGTIWGKLSDLDTKAPLIGANILLLSTIYGAATDLEGNYLIENVPVGSYSLEFSYIGYQTVTKTDIIVRPQRITVVNADLQILPVSSDEVVVTAGYFPKVGDQRLSVINFSREEIRRAPGSAGDVSRIILGLPSLAKMNDQSNNLIVRGGSPLENTFYIDNMEIPNINHFPTQGASGGALSLLNVDFIEDVKFYTGGFSAVYGDKLSSIMDLRFREGNRQEYDVQLDLNFAGFGGIAEGPLFSQKGSWLVSARRSYLDMLVDLVNVGSTMAPRYGDYQSKLVFDPHPSHQFILLGVFGDEHNRPDRQTAIENDMVYYGNQDNYQNMLGGNWRVLWSGRGYSNTSISYSSAKYAEDFYETGSGYPMIRNRSLEQTLTLRNLNHLKLNTHHSFEFGAETKFLKSDYDNLYAEYSDAFGQTVPAVMVAETVSEQKAAGFVSYIFQLALPLTATLGLRADYFSYNQKYNFSPRFSFSWQVSSRFVINGATGLYYQNLPLYLTAIYQGDRSLKDLYSTHYIAGAEYLISAETRFTIEIYQKNYQNFPIDTTQPSLFLLDELYYREGYGFNKEQISSVGKAYSRGIELMIQKKLAKDFYGLASASYFRTRYCGADQMWRDRIFDNRLILSVEGGYKPNSRWEFSLRWIYAGGRPYTQYDVAASQEANQAILDNSMVNASRYPAYHSLNVRGDRRFHFSGSNLIFYLSVWNTYNRKNVSSYYWNQIENKPAIIYQFSLLPVFGLEYEF